MSLLHICSQKHDAVFLSEVPEDLICIICSQVLTDPLQIMLCGHRFCGDCFDKMIKHSNETRSDLLCPMDRHLIQRDKVFQDNGAARAIRNLKVRCKGYELGCEWTGSLGDMNEHSAKCKFALNYCLPDDDSSMHNNSQLLQRVIRCEEQVESKEKELAHLKFAIKEMKDKFDKEREETKALKGSITYLLNEVHNLKEKSEEIIKKYSSEIKEITEKNALIENEIRCYKEVRIGASMEETASKQIKKIHEESNNQMEMIRKEIRSTRSHIDKSINKKTTEIKEITEILTNMKQVRVIENRNRAAEIKEITDKLSNTNENTTSIINLERQVQLIGNENTTYIVNLERQVQLIGNSMFLFDSVSSKKVQFKWILENFYYHFAIGKTVLSPVFPSQISSYRFKLEVSWYGEGEKDMGVFLKLCRGRNEKGLIRELPPFNHEFSLGIQNKFGVSTEYRVFSADIEKLSASIEDNKDQSRLSTGFKKLISSPYDDYIIDGSMYITCTVHLS